MKRIPLVQLKKILRVGDYVGCWESRFEKVLTVNEAGFTYGTLYGNLVIPWNPTETGYKTYYWLPGDLLESTDTIRKIKQARLKEYKQCT